MNKSGIVIVLCAYCELPSKCTEYDELPNNDQIKSEYTCDNCGEVTNIVQITRPKYPSDDEDDEK